MQIGTLPNQSRPQRPLKMVAVGDSLTAGMQDANLIGERQQVSYPALVARQAGLEFKQPLIKPEGIPPRVFHGPEASLGQALWRYAQVGLAALPALTCLHFGLVPPEALLWPVYHAGNMGGLEQKQTVQNFAIPGFELRELNDVANVKDLMGEMADHANGSGGLIAVGPFVRNILQDGRWNWHGRSEVDKAVAQDPDLVLLWGGNNDALESALVGHVDDQTLTPMDDQTWTYHSYNPLTGVRTPHQTDKVMPGFRTSLVGPQGVVTRLLAETDAEIVMMNIPDVTVVPHLRRLGERVGPLPFRIVLPNGADVTPKIENWVLPRTIRGAGHDGRESFPEGTSVGLGVLLSKFTHYWKVQNEEQLDSALASMAAERGVFSEDEVLDPQELARIQKRGAEFNDLIGQVARDNPRVHLVNIQALLNGAQKQGLPLRGQGPAETITNTFTGQRDGRGYAGLFSYDGVHPSDVGYAVVANRILDTVKAELGADPRFAAFAQAAPVDEKAALAADPHLGHPPALILEAASVDRLLCAQ